MTARAISLGTGMARTVITSTIIAGTATVIAIIIAAGASVMMMMIMGTGTGAAAVTTAINQFLVSC